MHSVEDVKPDEWVPLSRSHIFTEQRRYYEQLGPSAWAGSGAVPSYITSNTFIADRYLRCIIDAASSSVGDFAVLEFGSGSGELAFLIIATWIDLCLRREWNPNRMFYIMSDAVPHNVHSYCTHPQLLEFARRGLVDFALIDVLRPNYPINLLHSRAKFAPSKFCSLSIIANYVLDSLPHDLYSFFRKNVEFRQMEVCTKPRLKTRMRAMRRTDHLPSDIRHFLEEQCGSDQADRVVLIPIGAVEMIRFIRHCFKGFPTLLLIADKCESTSGLNPENPLIPLALHGSFSLPVNFDFLAFICSFYGGWVWRTGTNYTRLGVMVVSFNTASISAAVQFMEPFSVYDFYELQDAVGNNQFAVASVNHVLSFLRLSVFDARFFHKLKDRLLALITGRELDPGLFNDLRFAMHLVVAHCYRLEPSSDIIFEVAQVLQEMRLYEDAASMCNLSIRLYGPHPLVVLTRGLLLAQLGQHALAMKEFQVLIHQNPSLPSAWDRLLFFQVPTPR